MKVALIGLTHPFRGGIAHYTTLLYRELKINHSVKLNSLKKQYPTLLFPGKSQLDESQERIEAENEPTLHPLTPWSWMAAFSKIKAFSPDLTLFQWWHPFFAPSFGTLAGWLKRWGQTKIVFLCHNVRPHEPTLLDTVLLTYAFRSPDHFIVHSESDLRILKELKPGARVIRTSHPTYEIFGAGKRVDPSTAKRELGVEGDVILFFGYVRRYKGLEYLLQAFPKVLKERRCTLLVVGEIYEDKERYLGMIEHYRLADNLRLTDQYIPNEKVALYFSAADVVVLPYVSATQSGIIQIAYGLNKPVISTRVGGIPEAVVDGKTGFLVEPGNPDALADAILKFYRERDEIDFSRNIEEFKESFSWERLVKLIENLHEGSLPEDRPDRYKPDREK